MNHCFLLSSGRAMMDRRGSSLSIIAVQAQNVNRFGVRLVVRHLCFEPGFEFVLLVDLCAIHWAEREYSYEVVYHLLSLTRKQRLRLRARLGEEGEIDSVVPIWGTADWHEREAFDLVGIRFRGHPDLRRILMPDDFEGHPLRRDFPLEQ